MADRFENALAATGCLWTILCMSIILGLIVGYIMNIVALCNCDFEPNYKAEVIRSIGIVVPPVGAVAGWIHIEDGPPKPVEFK